MLLFWPSTFTDAFSAEDKSTEIDHRQLIGGGIADGSSYPAVEGDDVVGRGRVETEAVDDQGSRIHAQARRTFRYNGDHGGHLHGVRALSALLVTVAVKVPVARPLRPVTVSVVAVARVTFPVTPPNVTVFLAAVAEKP